MGSEIVKQKKYFIDCGAYDGCSVRFFRQKCDPNCQYHIYSFEANPKYARNFPKFENHTFYNKAVWIYNGIADFYLSYSAFQDGSTLIKDKITGNLDKEKPMTIECIDLSGWIKKNLNRQDYIILKMNIEGAEYRVLEKMIEDNTIDYINRLFVNWHWHKISLSKDIHVDLINKINIPIEHWNEAEKLGIARVRYNNYYKSTRSQIARLEHLQTIEENVQYGEKIFNDGHHKEAEEIFRKVLSSHPNHSKAHNNLACLLWQKGRIKEALQEFTRAMEIDPDDRDAVWNTGQIMRSIGLEQDAREVYDSYLKKHPEEQEIVEALAQWEKETAKSSDRKI